MPDLSSLLHLTADQYFNAFFVGALAGYTLASLAPRKGKAPLVFFSVCLHIASLAFRTMEAGRLPLVGVFDTLSFFALLVACMALIFHRVYGRMTFLEGGAVMATMMMLFDMMAPNALHPLPPVLRTLWFEVHVVLSFLSYALFAMGFLGGLDYFLSGKDPASLEAEYRANLWGYLAFSTAMIAGGIWAYFAWGTYWLWTPKELWTTIVWFYYSLYLHARIVRGWKESTRAVLAMTGFAVVMFTYLGVGLLMKSSHQF